MTETLTTREISIDIGEYRGFDYIVDLYTRTGFRIHKSKVYRVYANSPRAKYFATRANVPTKPDGFIDHRHHINGVHALVDWIYDNQKETRN